MEASYALRNTFDYDLAFSRNIGWLLPEEQSVISSIRVGIVGMGGVGGQYAEILTRLGVQNFLIADFDKFSIENTNRQNECRSSNYNQNKAETMMNLIKDINPNARVTCWNQGIREQDIQTFCESVDIYLDGLDFFEVNLRRKVFQKMQEFKKPAMTAGPIGCGTAFLVFDKDSMSFDDYFGFRDSDPDLMKYAKFLIGLDTSLHLSYLQDSSRLDLTHKKAPSLPIGVYSCASIMAASFLKIVLKRGEVQTAPWIFHYDPYLLKSVRRRIHFGFKNPLQKLKLKILLKRFSDLGL